MPTTYHVLDAAFPRGVEIVQTAQRSEQVDPIWKTELNDRARAPEIIACPTQGAEWCAEGRPRRPRTVGALWVRIDSRVEILRTTQYAVNGHGMRPNHASVLRSGCAGYR